LAAEIAATPVKTGVLTEQKIQAKRLLNNHGDGQFFK
jgi:hypothetical protein